jgi:ParB family chromosome partitioning protein
LSLASSTVVKALSLLDLDPAVRAQVEAGELAPASAYEVSKLAAPGEQVEVAERIVAEKLTRDQAATAVRERADRGAKQATGRRRKDGAGGQGGQAGHGSPP